MNAAQMISAMIDIENKANKDVDPDERRLIQNVNDPDRIKDFDCSPHGLLLWTRVDDGRSAVTLP